MARVPVVAMVLGHVLPGAALLLSASNSSEHLVAVAHEHAPLSALINEVGQRAEELQSTNDPQLTEIRRRLLAFASAIRLDAQYKREGGRSTAKISARKVSREDEEEGSKGHAFEEIAADKQCAASGKLGQFKKKVKEAKDCIPACAEESGCVAFVFFQKPFKMCQLYSACGQQEDANIVRKAYLWAIKNDDGDIETKATCGKLKDFPNSKPANWKEVKKEKNVATQAVAYVEGDAVKYNCDRDHSIDGSKDGDKEYMVTCSEQGFFVPDKYGCVGASECGPLPCVRKAHPSGKVEGDAKNPTVEMVCDDGYSLDGEKVVAGGNLNNAHLYVECAMTGKWSAPKNYLGKKGKACTPFAFVPASNLIKMYNKVFEVLFVASCNKELNKWAEMAEAVPPKLEDGTVCGEYVADDKEGDCKSLVDDLKTLFEDVKGGDKQGGFDAKGFCKDMWDLLKMDEPAAKTTC